MGACALFLFFSCEKKNLAPSFDNVKISFVDEGAGKPTLVFIHGWCTDNTLWENQIEYFKKNHRVVAIDLAGHGKSGKMRTNWNPENFARDVVAVVHSLDLEEVILVAHSISEDVVIRTTRMIPQRVKGVIGIENFKAVNLQYSDSLEREAQRFFGLMERNFRITSELYANEYLFAPETPGKVRRQIMDYVKASDKEIAIPVLRLLYTDYQQEKRFLKELITPLYLINSTFQPTDTVALNQWCNYGYVLREMNNVGHFPMLEDPETFNKLLEETIEEIRQLDFEQY
jgi:pimeloyl-ACP methyl ester carboxylesterase